MSARSILSCSVLISVSNTVFLAGSSCFWLRNPVPKAETAVAMVLSFCARTMTFLAAFLHLVPCGLHLGVGDFNFRYFSFTFLANSGENFLMLLKCGRVSRLFSFWAYVKFAHGKLFVLRRQLVWGKSLSFYVLLTTYVEIDMMYI